MITLQDLIIAYRKAKVDLFYSTNASLHAIANYEEKLIDNLTALMSKINGEDEKWVKTDEFIGTWTLIPKSIDFERLKKKSKGINNGLIFSSPKDEWDYTLSHSDVKPTAEFRIMARCSLDFHVLSTLWMLEVGHLYDSKLNDSSYGNRLRRTEDGKSINSLSLGTFQPYLKPFRNWRDNGIRAMKSSLDDGKKIVAITADVTSFYHELNPEFMLDKAFQTEILKLELDDFQSKLNRLFIGALIAWAKKTPLKKGLPVGLPASAVVANMALIELDRLIEEDIAPIYYGRYVDDILLVMENGKSFRSTEDVWEWLFQRSKGLLAWGDGNKVKVDYQSTYLNSQKRKSKVQFDNNKNKVFLLHGETGKNLVNAIVDQIQSRASEWRALPEIPSSANLVGLDVLAAMQNDGELADSLRKTDALSMRRAGFAIKLRDLEAFERDLEPDLWKDHRHAFFQAVIDHVLVLPHYFDLAMYVPRIIRVATACEDFYMLKKILVALEELCERVRDKCKLSIKAIQKNKKISENIYDNWTINLYENIKDSIASAFPPQLSTKGELEWQDHMHNYHPVISNDIMLNWSLDIKGFIEYRNRLFSVDLAHTPFRFIGLPNNMVSKRGNIANKSDIKFTDITPYLWESVFSGYQKLSTWLRFDSIPNGLIFATRPFNSAELTLIKPGYSQTIINDLNDILQVIRGYSSKGMLTIKFDENIVKVPGSVVQQKIRIAVSSWLTKESSWRAAVCNDQDPDINRYSRLCSFLNGLITTPTGCSYFILPELSIPSRWFMRIAQKLKAVSISLIAGIEYIYADNGVVRNQVWASLIQENDGFKSIYIHKQDKQRPAQIEEQSLYNLNESRLVPEVSWANDEPPIIRHGGFHFGILICSEFLNINYRAAYRGKIDCLFIPEWNKDTETYNSLVEASALDLHAYIIQCNNREFGDSRIRVPHKHNWKRDELRVKGGVLDYIVIGEIDVKALREFQSWSRSPDEPFKPIPDGFEIHPERKELPLGGSDE